MPTTHKEGYGALVDDADYGKSPIGRPRKASSGVCQGRAGVKYAAVALALAGALALVLYLALRDSSENNDKVVQKEFPVPFNSSLVRCACL